MKIPLALVAQLEALAKSPKRRVNPAFAAQYLGKSIRFLEEWRRGWKQAAEQGDASLRRGPPFLKIGKHIRYEMAALDEFLAACNVQSYRKE